jgi:hypothetical protein
MRMLDPGRDTAHPSKALNAITEPEGSRASGCAFACGPHNRRRIQNQTTEKQRWGVTDLSTHKGPLSPLRAQVRTAYRPMFPTKGRSHGPQSAAAWIDPAAGEAAA